jgi:hypothetical protein
MTVLKQRKEGDRGTREETIHADVERRECVITKLWWWVRARDKRTGGGGTWERPPQKGGRGLETLETAPDGPPQSCSAPRPLHPKQFPYFRSRLPCCAGFAQEGHEGEPAGLWGQTSEETHLPSPPLSARKGPLDSWAYLGTLIGQSLSVRRQPPSEQTAQARTWVNLANHEANGPYPCQSVDFQTPPPLFPFLAAIRSYHEVSIE